MGEKSITLLAPLGHTVFMDLATRIDIVRLYYQNGSSATSVLRCYMTQHQLKREPFTIKTVINLIKKFEQYGVVTDLPKSGRPGVSDEIVDQVHEARNIGMTDSATGCFSSVQISRASGIPRSTVLKILHKKLNMRPYRLKMVHALAENDYVPRVRFAEWFLEVTEDPNFLSRVLWSDEAHFYLNGKVCGNQCIIWDTDNPHEYREKPLHSEKVTVWCAFTNKFILPPYFVDAPATVDQVVYSNIIKNHVIPSLPRQHNYVFMQDGATPHTANAVKELLRKTFGESRVISRGFTNNWPSRSPDLNPCDYFLWGYLKNRVFRNNPQTIHALKQAISHEITNLSAELLGRSIENLYDRLIYVIGQEGKHIEH